MRGAPHENRTRSYPEPDDHGGHHQKTGHAPDDHTKDDHGGHHPRNRGQDAHMRGAPHENRTRSYLALDDLYGLLQKRCGASSNLGRRCVCSVGATNWPFFVQA
jgi:hypothetical protein